MCEAPLLYSLASCPAEQDGMCRTVVPHWEFEAAQQLEKKEVYCLVIQDEQLNI